VALILVGIALGALPLGLVAWLWRILRGAGNLSPRRTLLMLGGGAAAGGVSAYLEAVVFDLTGLALDASQAGVQGALLAMFLFAAPLGQALKVAVVWPLYRSRRITRPEVGMFYAAAVGGGYAASRVVSELVTAPLDALLLVRLLIGVPAHLFCAGVWGYALGSGRTRGRWFPASWVGATLLQGLYEHIVFGRGPGMLVATLPLLAVMGLVSWIALRDASAGPDSRVSSSHRTLVPTLPDPPSIGAVRRALSRSDRPLALRWIGIGTFVTIGVMMVVLALSVYVGHRVGVDFAMADEADVRSSGPLVLLGTAFLAAFPIAGYLVAKASGSGSVLEPALAAGLAIVTVVVVVSMASPQAVVFALAAAPVAFALACGGAWFGLAR